MAALAVTSQAVAQANKWAAAKCDLKPGHYLVNSGLLYLKSATETRFEDQKQKDLRDANNVLTQALTTGNQDKNPAAWYYFGRYYIMVRDLTGADSAFTRAQALKPDCKDDIATWRQNLWRDAMNAGIAAWQANNTDSAIKSFRRANAIWQGDPVGFLYLGSLLYQAGQTDSGAIYFRRSADIAAKDSTKVKERKDALFNLARIEHTQSHWAEAEAAYREYLTVAPRDPEALGSLGSVLMQRGQRDSAFAIYKQIIGRGDSAGSIPLFRAGVAIYQGAPEAPDTTALGRSCRTQGQTAGRPVAAARLRVCRDSMTKLMREYQVASDSTFRLAAQAFEAGLRVNPYFRDGLYNLVSTYSILNDSASILPMARRLVSVDPLNRESLRRLAFAHQRVGQLDSTIYYLRIADSTLVVDVTVNDFAPDDQSATVKGTVTNLRTARSDTLKLVFEFMNAKGEVAATQQVKVPALEPQQSQAFEAKVTGAGLVAWRYRKG
jgi:tetratricopeptide (TPR) repeat protein